MNIPSKKRKTNGAARYIFRELGLLLFLNGQGLSKQTYEYKQFTYIVCPIKKHAVSAMKTVTERNFIGLLCKFVERSQRTTEIGMSVDFCVS